MKPALLFFCLLLLPRPASAQTYTVTDLGTLPGGTYSSAAAINNLGHVTGTAEAFINTYIKNNTERGAEAFFWHDGVMEDIGEHNGLSTGGYAINDSDEIVGTAMDTCGYTSSSWKMRAKHYELGGYGCAYGINNKGQTAGEQHGFYDPPPYTDQCGINDAGLIVGSADVSAKPGTQPHHAVLWNKGKRQDLGTLGGTESRAIAINAAGQIVGASSLSPTHGPDPVLYHAARWDSGKISDLGTLPGDKQSNANAINAQGDVVGASGERGCLWQGGRAVDLNTLIPAGSGWVLQGASGINNRGQIVGNGLHHGKRRGYLLTPK